MPLNAEVVELVDTRHLKCREHLLARVRIPPSAPKDLYVQVLTVEGNATVL